MPATNPFDRKLTAVLKSLSKGIKDAPAREKVDKEFQSVRGRVIDAMLGQVLDDLFKSLSMSAEQSIKPDQAKAVTVIRTLSDRQFVSSAAFLFGSWRGLFACLALDVALPLAPDAASFEIWRKASGQPPKEIEQKLLAELAPTYTTAGADWLLLHVPPEKQLPLLDTFLTRQPRPKYLPAWSEALAAALQKDKRGALLRTVLRQSSPDQDRGLALAEVIRSSPVLMKSVINELPPILTAKEPPAGALALIRNIFADLINTSGSDRQFISALLARLGTGILLHRDLGHVASQALDYIQQTARQLRAITRDVENQSQTWVLESLKAEELPNHGQLQITLDGAIRFAVAFEKAEQNFPAVDILTMTAHNLGLAEIGQPGQSVAYDPIQHEAIDAGLIPGDPAVLESRGWLHGEHVVLRARVRKMKE